MFSLYALWTTKLSNICICTFLENIELEVSFVIKKIFNCNIAYVNWVLLWIVGSAWTLLENYLNFVGLVDGLRVMDFGKTFFDEPIWILVFFFYLTFLPSHISIWNSFFSISYTLQIHRTISFSRSLACSTLACGGQVTRVVMLYHTWCLQGPRQLSLKCSQVSNVLILYYTWCLQGPNSLLVGPIDLHPLFFVLLGLDLIGLLGHSQAPLPFMGSCWALLENYLNFSWLVNELKVLSLIRLFLMGQTYTKMVKTVLISLIFFFYLTFLLSYYSMWNSLFLLSNMNWYYKALPEFEIYNMAYAY